MTFVGLCAVVILLWLGVPSLINGNTDDLTTAGQVGDSFGSVNALFTGLAFSGIVFTILLQQREIRLQRVDFLSQLREMEQSRKEVAEQNKILRCQMEVQLLEVVAQAYSLRSMGNEMRARQWAVGSAHFQKEADRIVNQSEELERRAMDLRSRIEG